MFPSTFLVIALGLFFNPEVRKLPPSLNSIWLVLHVTFYKIALGTILIALAFSLFYILKKRTKIGWLSRLPERDGRCLCIQVCRVRIYFLGDRHAYRIDLGVPVMGQVLGLGPGGDMVADYLGVFRALPAPQEVLWVVRGTGRLFLFSLFFTLTSFCVLYPTY